MKNTTIYCCIVMLLSLSGMGQTIVHPVDYYENICKIWGVCKYYSPSANIYDADWDSILTQKLDYLNKSTKPNIDSLYSSFFYEEEEYSSYRSNRTDSFVDSIYNALEFFPLLNSNIKKNLYSLFRCEYDSLKYVDYIYPQGNTIHLGERTKSTNVYPDIKYRLLSLFRYWNVIFYFYPYKTMIPVNWNNVLSENIPLFLDAKNAVEYHLALKALAVSIQDSHSFVSSSVFQNNFFRKQLPLLFTFVNDSLVVEHTLDSVQFVEDLAISKGDIILEINNESIFNIKDKYFKFSEGSNIFRKNFMVSAYARWVMIDTVPITYLHQKTIQKGHIISLDNTVFNNRYDSINNAKINYCLINDTLGYINLNYLSISKIPEMINLMFNTKGIIFDTRSYPQFSMYSLLPYLPHDTITPSFAGWRPTNGLPGSFDYFRVEPLTQLKDSLYKGDVIILVNVESLSRCEFYAMALQLCNKSITIGSTTAGADGDVSTVTLPGNIKTWFSGIAIEYANGEKTQQNGVKIDIPITMSPSDYRIYKDPYLQKVIEAYYSR